MGQRRIGGVTRVSRHYTHDQKRLSGTAQCNAPGCRRRGEILDNGIAVCWFHRTSRFAVDDGDGETLIVDKGIVVGWNVPS